MKSLKSYILVGQSRLIIFHNHCIIIIRGIWPSSYYSYTMQFYPDNRVNAKKLVKGLGAEYITVIQRHFVVYQLYMLLLLGLAHVCNRQLILIT